MNLCFETHGWDTADVFVVRKVGVRDRTSLPCLSRKELVILSISEGCEFRYYFFQSMNAVKFNFSTGTFCVGF